MKRVLSILMIFIFFSCSTESSHKTNDPTMKNQNGGYEDADQDGYSVENDCDDANSSYHPGAQEIADNGIDENCDGSDAIVWYQDADNDGYGNHAVLVAAESKPNGYVAIGNDCDDTDVTVHPSSTEIFGNGIDEDCDGIDNACIENLVRHTYAICGVGECAGNPETETCINGQWTNRICDPFKGAAEEQCDNRDNDCDGVVDNDIPSEVIQCGVGVCAAAGERHCLNGRMVDSCVPGDPQAEICDGLDNDCDGLVDNNTSNETFQCGVGACAASGESSCIDGVIVDSCMPGEPQAEICDGLDNDCDGEIDEELNCGLGGLFTNRIGMTFVTVSAGTFMMGSPEEETGHRPDETAHEVTLTQSFYMQTTEVTQRQWSEVMGGENPAHFSECGEACPVENVTWDDVRIFIERLNDQGEGEYRLPTEAEWEYASRAGTDTPFSAGQCLSADNANYNGAVPYTDCAIGDPREETVPVENLLPNAWGLYGMHGNVREWCADIYGSEYYGHLPVTDPVGPETGVEYVNRGGSWNDGAENCRSAARSHNESGYRDNRTGFRVVLVREQ